MPFVKGTHTTKRIEDGWGFLSAHDDKTRKYTCAVTAPPAGVASKLT
jgi:hypothetical protein